LIRALPHHDVDLFLVLVAVGEGNPEARLEAEVRHADAFEPEGPLRESRLHLRGEAEARGHVFDFVEVLLRVAGHGPDATPW
jgi:hypothetical protein